MSDTSRPLTAFKSYDVRGQVGIDLDADLAFRIGQAFVAILGAESVVVGRDCRASGPELQTALMRGITEAGADVMDIGLSGTEEVYFATDHLGASGGIEVTASHNPIDYNGMKLVGPGARPLTDEEFQAIRTHVGQGVSLKAAQPGTITAKAPRDAYADHVSAFVDAAALAPLKIVVNAGNGAAGAAFDAIAERLRAGGAKLDFVTINHRADGSFPNGIPNPLLPENRAATADPVRAHGADLGVAWDGDFDRCFFFDANGDFVDGEYVVALLAQAVLADGPTAIVHDPRVMWNTVETITANGGTPVAARTGHAFLKRALRETGAAYGGEMSAHHYFRDFMCCDSGMIPWLKIVALMSRTGQPLASLVADMRAAFPSSGERNFRVTDATTARDAIEAHFAPHKPEIDRLDGLSMAFDQWRLNLRSSSTEPLLRLNVEARGDAQLVADKVAEIEGLLQPFLS